MKSISHSRNVSKQGPHFQSKGLRRAIIGAAALVGTSVPMAQAQTDPGARTLEEIVVTARRRKEMLQNVPIAITALGNEYLREQNITNALDLGTHAPSMRMSDASGSTNAPIVSIRGQRPTEVLITLDPAVPLYFADVVLTPTMGTNLAMYDLENVQVLKGPQGTLFGRNSTGGALLFSPQQPGEEFGGYTEVRLGNYDLVHVEGAVDLPVNDALRFRLAGRKVERDGYQSNVAYNALRCDDCLWDEDSYGLRLSMEVTPTDRLRNLTMVSYDENDMNSRVVVPRAFIGSSQSSVPTLANLIHNGGLGQLNALFPDLNIPGLQENLWVKHSPVEAEFLLKAV